MSLFYKEEHLTLSLIHIFQQRPNIVFILADDMGYGDVSAFNENSHIQTNNIDQMAANGVIFTDAHSCSSVSTPTRYGIITCLLYTSEL